MPLKGDLRGYEAERAGFEPATDLSARTRFPVALLRPLGHLSAALSVSPAGQKRSRRRSPRDLQGRRRKRRRRTARTPLRGAQRIAGRSKTVAQAKPTRPPGSAPQAAPTDRSDTSPRRAG